MKIRIEAGHFWIGFDNGYTLSVFNGYGSHTENNFATEKFIEIIKEKNVFQYWESEHVEIAVIKDGELITNTIIESDDSVKTVDLKELIDIINLLKEME